MYSSATGGLLPCGARLDGAFWWRMVRYPALFAEAAAAAIQDGCRTFLEVGPHPVLSRALEDTAGLLGRGVSALPLMNRDCASLEHVLRTVGA
jgi:acyl transferase domain-containing protein